MKKLKTLTLGIPAFNEEANIKQLLESLLSQKRNNFILEKIIVISDGSSDHTVTQVNKIKNRQIKLINQKKNLGKIRTQNEILNKSTSDVLVLLDADVKPDGTNFIDNLVKPFLLNNRIGVVGGDTVSIEGRGLIERIFSNSHSIKKRVYRQINGGNNIYMCHGRVRAFSKKFYSQLKWQGECAEDAYSYLSCIKQGYKFFYQPEAKVFFRSPTTISDHIKQSLRFIYGKKHLEKYFPKAFVREEYGIPKLLLLKTVFYFLANEPQHTTFYLFINIYIRILKKLKLSKYKRWEISISTKRLVI